MPFLTEADYRKVIKDVSLSQIIEGDVTIRTDCELATQKEIESYLNHDFDVLNIFNKVGAARDPVVVMYMVDMVIFHLCSRVAPQKAPGLRQDRYNAAKLWLKAVGRGEIRPDLPLRSLEDKPNTLTRFGSNTKFGSNY